MRLKISIKSCIQSKSSIPASFSVNIVLVSILKGPIPGNFRLPAARKGPFGATQRSLRAKKRVLKSKIVEFGRIALLCVLPKPSAGQISRNAERIAPNPGILTKRLTFSKGRGILYTYYMFLFLF